LIVRAYLIDELAPPDMERIGAFLKEMAISSGLQNVFWVKILDDLLSKAQSDHTACQPHVFAVELGVSWMKLEFFVRSLTSLRCACSAYATPAQREFILDFAHGMIDTLHIET
jgi:hypothetical protein